MADVTMPRLSDSMEEGTILKWLKSDGDEVAKGEELVEIETDKATMTYEADSNGVLEIVAGEGDTLPIGETIARLGDGSGKGSSTAEEDSADGGDEAQGDDSPDEGDEKAQADDSADEGNEKAQGDDSPDEGDGGREPEPAREPAAAASGNGGDPATEATPAPATPDGDGADGERVKASPVARRMARELSVDLQGVSGSGPGGRIVKADVEAAAGDGAAPEEAPAEEAREEAPARERAPAASATDGATGKGEATVEELSRTQQLIARRMAESRATVPDFNLVIDIDMEAAVGLRAELKGAAGEGQAVPSLNDLVVKASAIALREFPRVNGSYKDGRFELHGRVNVGVAVAGEDALVVPTVFDADTKSLGLIARDTRRLAQRVRDKQITPPELSGGTFTVSNLGMFGIDRFTAVINPPQAAILAVGSVAPRVVVHEDKMLARATMTATLACDHRILYGADAAQFLGRVRDLLEQPLALAL